MILVEAFGLSSSHSYPAHPAEPSQQWESRAAFVLFISAIKTLMLDRSSSQQGSCKKKLPGLGFKLDFKNSGESQSVCVIQIKSMSLDAERNFAVNRTNQI